MALPIHARLSACERRFWIPHSNALRVLDQLDDLAECDAPGRRRNMLVLGSGANGKSTLLARYAERHRPEDGAKVPQPVIDIVMPEAPRATSLWSAILDRLDVRSSEREPTEIRRELAMERLAAARSRVLAVDDFDRIVDAGRERGAVLDLFDDLSRELRMAIVATGSETTLDTLARGRDPIHFATTSLDRWSLNDEYLRLLAAYERMLPLARPSQLACRDIAARVLALGGNVLGGTARVLNRAARTAILSGKERIDTAVLESLGSTSMSRLRLSPL